VAVSNEIVSLTGLSILSVKRYRKQIDSTIKKPKIVNDDLGTPKNVKKDLFRNTSNKQTLSNSKNTAV
jgi:hypothetical protein